MPLKLFITQCSDDMRWYSEFIGEYVTYEPQADDGILYGSREPAGYLNFVLKTDAIVKEVDDDATL